MHEVNMDVRKIETLFNLLSSLGTVQQAKLAYAIAKNKNYIKGFLVAYQEAVKPTPAVLEFEKARQQLLEEHADKDPNTGKAIKAPVPGRTGLWQYALKNETEYQVALERLKKDHEQGVKDVADLEMKQQQLMEVVEVVTLHQVKYSDLKEDDRGNLPISASQLSDLLEAGIIIEE